MDSYKINIYSSITKDRSCQHPLKYKIDGFINEFKRRRD